jgi:hypothetical protein
MNSIEEAFFLISHFSGKASGVDRWFAALKDDKSARTIINDKHR